MPGNQGGARNYPKHRVFHRLIELLQERDRPMTARQIADELHIVHGSASARIRALQRGVADFPKLYIADWSPPRGMGSHQPMFAIGDKPDVAIKRVGRHAVRLRPKFNPSATRDALLLQLAKGHPMTVKELATQLKRSESAISRTLNKLKEGVVPLAPVRIAGHTLNTRNKPSPAWAIGDWHDAGYKKRDRAERNRVYRERYKALVAARQRVKRTGVVASPFDWLIQQAAA